MKRVFVFLLFFIVQASLCAQIRYHICDEDGEIPSVYVFVNGEFATVTDGRGIATVNNLHKGDSVRITHLGHLSVEYVIISEPKDTAIFLSPQYFTLDKTEYVKDFDYDILDEKLRRNLSVGHIGETVSCVSKDTIITGGRKLFLEESFAVSFPLIGKNF